MKISRPLAIISLAILSLAPSSFAGSLMQEPQLQKLAVDCKIANAIATTSQFIKDYEAAAAGKNLTEVQSKAIGFSMSHYDEDNTKDAEGMVAKIRDQKDAAKDEAVKIACLKALVETDKYSAALAAKIAVLKMIEEEKAKQAAQGAASASQTDYVCKAKQFTGDGFAMAELKYAYPSIQGKYTDQKACSEACAKAYDFIETHSDSDFVAQGAPYYGGPICLPDSKVIVVNDIRALITKEEIKRKEIEEQKATAHTLAHSAE